MRAARYLLSSLVVLSIVLVLVFALQEDEPTWNGIPASQWALQIKLASPTDPAVQALLEIGPPAIPSIISAYEGSPLEIRRSRWYPKLRNSFPGVIQHYFPLPVDPPGNNTKAGIVSTLNRLRTNTAELEKFLLQETENPDHLIRMYSCEALGFLGCDSEPAVARTRVLLRDSNGAVRLSAIRTLHKLNRLRDPNLIPALEKLAEDEDQSWGTIIRGLALFALWDLQVPENEEKLAHFLSTAESKKILWPVARLKARGKDAAVFRPILSARLAAATNQYVRDELTSALESIDAKASK